MVAVPVPKPMPKAAAKSNVDNPNAFQALEVMVRQSSAIQNAPMMKHI